jgi:nucleoside-triphosphatase THEP1
LSSPRAETAAFGIVAYPEGGDVEALLADFAAALQAEGVRVGGLLQRSSKEANGRPRMELIDVESGETFLISQNLGAESSACCVDPSGVATASLVLRRAIAARPDLLIINKFSGLEAKGEGLRGEFLEALAGGLPVLAGLPDRHRAAFEAMAGGAYHELAASLPALKAWWRSAGAQPVAGHPGY